MNTRHSFFHGLPSIGAAFFFLQAIASVGPGVCRKRRAERGSARKAVDIQKKLCDNELVR